MRETVAFVVLLGGLMVAVAHCTAGCGLTAQDGQHFTDLSTKLAACRKEGYARIDAGASTAQGRMAYEDCKRREGIDGVE